MASAVDPESFFGYDRGTPELAKDDEVEEELLTPRRQRRKKSTDSLLSDEEVVGASSHPRQAIRRSPLAVEASEEASFVEMRRMVRDEVEKADAMANIADDTLERQMAALRKRAGIEPSKESAKAREIRAESGRVPGEGRREMPVKLRSPRANVAAPEEARQQQPEVAPRKRREMVRRRHDVSKKAVEVEDAWLASRNKVKVSSEHDNMGVDELASALAPGAAPPNREPKPPLPSR